LLLVSNQILTNRKRVHEVKTDSKGNLLPQFQLMARNLKIPLLLHPKVLESFASIVMTVLTKKSGSPVVQNVEGRTPVHCATANESPNGPQLLKILLVHKGDSNLKDILLD